ncbi:MAG: hypothetical protein WC916_02425 [Candidatus Woesearchaeota archaeon]
MNRFEEINEYEDMYNETEHDLPLRAIVMDRRTYLEWKTGIAVVQLK